MKAIVFDKKNSENQLQLCDLEKPVPAEGQVLIKIHAVSINAADYRSMQMGIIPNSKIFGADVAGVVEAVGKNASKFNVGDAVLGDLSSSGFGGFAEFVTAPETLLIRKHDDLSFAEAAAIPMASLTAIQALRDKGQIKPGMNVLIVGAGGGVGTFAVQLAKFYLTNVTAVCSTKNVDLVRSLGADKVIDYNKEDFSLSKSKYDLILAVNGSHPLIVYKHLMTPNGIFVLVGGGLSQIFATIVFGSLLSIGKMKMRFLAAKASVADLELIVKLVVEGKIKPVIDRCYPLEEAAQAVNYLRQGHASGKVVLQVVNS